MKINNQHELGKNLLSVMQHKISGYFLLIDIGTAKLRLITISYFDQFIFSASREKSFGHLKGNLEELILILVLSIDL